jgi:hypothetical protein
MSGMAVSGFVLRTYTHLVPNHDERAREAIDRVVGDDTANSDGPVVA